MNFGRIEAIVYKYLFRSDFITSIAVKLPVSVDL